VRDALALGLEYALSSPLVARTRAMEYVRPWASDRFCGDLSILVSELVTNAVLHGLPDIHLHVCAVAARRVRLEVFDGSDALPEVRNPSVEALSGRGLRIVDAIAVEWGARPLLDGKVVWCELMDQARVVR
jgi:hypothetical protein